MSTTHDYALATAEMPEPGNDNEPGPDEGLTCDPKDPRQMQFLYPMDAR